MARSRKPKPVSYELIDRDSPIGNPMYWLLDEVVDQHHPELRTARIALAWCTSWRPDVDGNVVIGKCMKASDLHRELAPWDFVILLARWYWRDDRTEPIHRRRLIDHECCHATRMLDKHGEPAEDERGRPVWRTRRHDYEEFVQIIARYGLEVTTRGREIAAAILRSPAGFKGCARCAEDPAGPSWNTLADGRVKKCVCHEEWRQIRAEVAELTS